MALTEGTRVLVSVAPEFGIPMTCLEAVKRGDLLGITGGTGTVFPVDSDDAEHGRLIAGEDGVAGGEIKCYWMAVISGFTAGTQGGAVYPSATPGQYTEAVDATAGDSNEIIGYILTATTILVLPGVRADSVVAT